MFMKGPVLMAPVRVGPRRVICNGCWGWSCASSWKGATLYLVVPRVVVDVVLQKATRCDGATCGSLRLLLSGGRRRT